MERPDELYITEMGYIWRESSNCTTDSSDILRVMASSMSRKEVADFGLSRDLQSLCAFSAFIPQFVHAFAFLLTLRICCFFLHIDLLGGQVVSFSSRTDMFEFVICPKKQNRENTSKQEATLPNQKKLRKQILCLLDDSSSVLYKYLILLGSGKLFRHFESRNMLE